MKNIFDVIPNNFFNLLASTSNNDIYAGALLIIYHVYDREISYKIKRNDVKDALILYILEEHLIERQEEERTAAPGDFASSILRKMIEAKWLEEESDSVTYEKNINMTESGIMLAEFLLQMQKPDKEEYASYIYNIYNTLKNQEQWQEDPYVNAIKNVYRNAKRLANSLKKLSTIIKKVIEKMVKEESLESLTENLMEYFEGTFIKEYARLTKQQNIHIYRNYIRRMLDSFLTDKELHDLMVIGCVIEEELEEKDAEEHIFKIIELTKSFLIEDYDKIMSDIKKKIIVYLNLAIGRARFLLNHEVNARGYVERTIKFMVQEAGQLDLKKELPDEMSELFHLYTQEFMDSSSIRFRRKQREITKALVTEIEEMTEEHINKARKEQEKEAYNPYDKKSMKMMVEALLNGKKEVSAEEFPISIKADMLSALSSVAYGKENGFEVELLDGYIERNGMYLHKFVIRRDKNEN